MGTPVRGFDEGRFRSWYHSRANRLGLDPNPDAPEHFYDYRAAFAAGAEPDKEGHWPSQFKLEGHPRMVIDGVNTKTGERSGSGWEDDPVVEAPSTMSRVGQGAIGALKGYGETMAETMGPLAMGPLGYMAAGMQAPDELNPTNPDQQLGYNLEGVAETVGGLAGAARPIAGAVRRVAGPAVARMGPGAAAAAKNVVINAAAGMVPGGPVIRAAAKAISDAATKETVKKAAPVAARTAVKAVEKVAPRVAAKVAPAAAKAATPVVSRGAEVAAKHNSLMQFAKGVAARNPKIGEKIWLLLDDAGTPVRELTSTEAGAAARKGLRTTWVKNLWAK